VASGGQINKVNDTLFKVKSQSSNKTYNVVWVAKRWTCSCADFTKRLRDCKHVYAIHYLSDIERISRANGCEAIKRN
jgi:hypothetical protein